MPRDFVRQLPMVHDLTGDDSCPICLDKYKPAEAPAPGIITRLVSMAVNRAPEPNRSEMEHAVRLPCQHVIGRDCIERWTSPLDGGQDTCPYVSVLAKLFLALC